jgi:hypothetical protein
VEDGLDAEVFADQSRGFSPEFHADVDDEDVDVARGELASDREADAARAAGYDGRFS